MRYVVQKYGGSSVASIERIKNVASRVIRKKEEGFGVVVVVSAMGKTTNTLIELAHEITKNPTKREMDVLMSTGEQISIAMLSIALNSMGHDAISLTGIQAGIKTEGPHTKNKIMDINGELIKKYLDDGKIVIVAGFQGVNDIGEITTLGRGGSDTSAVAIAAKINCPCEIYTDVDGIYSIDPRVYNKAKKLDEISFKEMMELASFGAKVLEPRSVGIAAKYGVELYVASSMNENKGTYIRESLSMENNLIKGVAIQENVLMLTYEGIDEDGKILSEVFGKVSDAKINVNLISQTLPIDKKQNVSFAIPKTDEIALDEIAEQIIQKYPNVEYKKIDNVSQVSVVGLGLVSNYGIASNIFTILQSINVKPLLISTSDINISLIIKSDDAKNAAIKIAETYNL